MATLTRWLASKNDTDANFRAWVQAVLDAFAAFGWVQTADTGQINSATVLKPAAANTSQGYAMWRMNDANQATMPVFLKAEFGSGGAATTYSLWFTLGTITNGAGVMSGQTSPRVQVSASGTPSGGTPDVSGNYRWMFSGSTSSFRMSSCNNADATTSPGTYSGFINIGRWRDATGNETSNGVSMHVHSIGQQVAQYAVPKTGAVPGIQDFASYGPRTGNGQRGTDVLMYPPYVWNISMQNPAIGFMTYFTADIPVDTLSPASVYGVQHNYWTLGPGASFGLNTVMTTSSKTAMGNNSLAMLWE